MEWPVVARSRRVLAVSVVLILGVDVLLIAADVLQRNHVLSDSRFLVTRERGFGEIFQYAKAAAAAVLLAGLAVRRRSATALLWAALLTFVAFDDSLQVHERAGRVLAAALPLPAIGSARPNHLGELLFFASAGFAAAIVFACVWLRADPADRRISRLLVWSFGALAVCAAGLDAVSAVTHDTALGPVFAVLEEGGEMLALTALFSSVLYLVSARPEPCAARLPHLASTR